MAFDSVLYDSRTARGAGAAAGDVPGLFALRGARRLVIGERALDRLERHLGWRPTRALAARFLECASPRQCRPGADRWFIRFRVFGQVLLAEMRMDGQGGGEAVWVATHLDHGPGLHGCGRVCTA
jgi:hypothetical protein